MQNAIPLPHRKTAADRRRLALEQIDARLSDHKNSEAQRALLIARRRYLANAERRGARARSRTFILEAARAADRSQATIYRDLRRVDELGVTMLEKIVGTALDHGLHLDALITVAPTERSALVHRAMNGETAESLLIKYRHIRMPN